VANIGDLVRLMNIKEMLYQMRFPIIILLAVLTGFGIMKLVNHTKEEVWDAPSTNGVGVEYWIMQCDKETIDIYRSWSNER